MFLQKLPADTYRAIEEKNTAKFLAEGQPVIGRRGHMAAVLKHRHVTSLPQINALLWTVSFAGRNIAPELLIHARGDSGPCNVG